MPSISKRREEGVQDPVPLVELAESLVTSSGWNKAAVFSPHP